MMSFEAPRNNDISDTSPFDSTHFEVRERIGGPLKANHLAMTKLGMKEAEQIFDSLHVARKVSLLSPEMSLSSEAVVPAEYRVEIMGANRTDMPAGDAYLEHVVDELRTNRVPFQRGAAESSNHKEEED